MVCEMPNSIVLFVQLSMNARSPIQKLTGPSVAKLFLYYYKVTRTRILMVCENTQLVTNSSTLYGTVLYARSMVTHRKPDRTKRCLTLVITIFLCFVRPSLLIRSLNLLTIFSQ